MRGQTLKRELLFATFCSAVFAALLVFQSCASKSKKADDANVAESEETVGDASLEEGTDAAEAEADAADLEATLETKDADKATTAGSEGEATASSEFDLPKTSDTTETNLEVPSASSTSEPTAASSSVAPSEESSTPPAALVEEPKKVAAYSGRARAPRIPGRAVKRKGTLLNRFYFVRSGDNATKVSQLLYGSDERAGSLMRWNGQDTKWTPGQIVYYASPVDGSDMQMKSFYQERSVPPEEYTVKPGDWLSQIAKAQLGHPGSWKEIAVVNGMDSPDALEKGQKLAIYPANLSSFADVAQAKTEAPAKAEVAAAQPEATPEVPVQNAPPPPPVEEVAPPKRQQAKGGLDLAKLLEQNLFAVVVGSAVILLLVALMAVNKRKKKGADDMADDGFSSAKARRK